MQTKQIEVKNNLYENVVKGLLRIVLLAACGAASVQVYADTATTPLINDPSISIGFGPRFSVTETQLGIANPAAQKVCFPQTFIDQGDYKSILLALSNIGIGITHNLIVPLSDQGAAGDVFVAISQQNQGEPQKFWYTADGSTWVAYDASTSPSTPYISTNNLAAIEQVRVSATAYEFANLSNTVLLVGYGLRNGCSATVSDSYQNMLANSRYTKIWFSPNTTSPIGWPVLAGKGAANPTQVSYYTQGIIDPFKTQLCFSTNNITVQQVVENPQ